MSNLTKAMQIIGSNVRGDRQKDDYYSTPPHATEALLDVESFEAVFMSHVVVKDI